MYSARNGVVGARTSQENPSTPAKVSKSARVQYVIQNRDTPNEHLMMIQEFKKPGTYRYYTSQGTDLTQPIVPYVNPTDKAAINRGLSMAVEFLRNPVIIPPQLPK